jgi:hypothetical protein
MANTAFQVHYRQEFIAGFEQRQSILRDFTTTEAVIKGNTATFLIADSNGATAVTRGVNGKIPNGVDNLTQTSATLAEWHYKPVVTSFNVFASQGDRHAIMQKNAMAVINRKVDQDIIDQLDTATLTTGAAAPASVRMVNKAIAGLGNNGVPMDGNIYAVITPAFLAYLYETTEFTSADYVNNKPFDGSSGPAWADKPGYWDWHGVKWCVSNQLTGVGTSSEKCYMFHKSSIGHAVNSAGMDVVLGYNDEDDYSFARVSIYMGSKLLQNSGVAQMLHDGSAMDIS